MGKKKTSRKTASTALAVGFKRSPRSSRGGLETRIPNGTTPTKYKHGFVTFIRSLEWHWFITVPIGECPDDDQVLQLLRRIEAHFCKKYVATRYHKLPDTNRFLMAVAFEGESKCGSRHAHLLVRLPGMNKKQISQSQLILLPPSCCCGPASRFSTFRPAGRRWS
jgi:hypothetical protein